MDIKRNLVQIGRQAKILLKNGFAHIFAGTFLNKAVTMLSSIVIARLVDKQQYAYLSYSDTIYGYLALFSGLGMGSALLKICAGKSEKKQDCAYLSYAIKCGMIFEIFVSIIFVGIFLIIKIPFPQARHYIVISVFYPVMYCIYDLLICYIRAKSFNKQYACVNLIYSILICIFSVVFVLIWNADGLIYARYLALSFMLIYVCCFVFLFLGKTSYFKLSVNQKRNFWKIAITLVIANAFSGMMPFNENMLLSHIIADEVILANYRVAGLFPQMILLITQAVNIYFFPIAAGMDNEGIGITKFGIKVGLLNAAMVIIGMIGGILFTPIFLPLFYGKKYSDAVGISLGLWIMRGMNAGIRMVPMNMLIAIGKYRFNLKMSVFTFVIQIIVDWIFIIQWGVHGMVFGTIFIYLITGILYWTAFIHASSSKFD